MTTERLKGIEYDNTNSEMTRSKKKMTLDSLTLKLDYLRFALVCFKLITDTKNKLLQIENERFS